MTQPASQVAERASFEEMRGHVLGLYTGVTVKHSFLVDGHPYDCVPVAQQPTVRALGLTSIPTPPSIASAPAASAGGPAAALTSQLDPNVTVDPAGNTIGCVDGTIPMRRVTLEDVGRFKSLADFLHKGPNGTGLHEYPDPAIRSAAAATHKYAHSYQYVTNLGGTTKINLWSPYVNTSLGEIFSLAQFWYVNTTSPIQTVEGGIQNYPQKYGPNKSVLFIYWTSDGYNSVGCYNLDCAGFVQTNKSIFLGSGFSKYSTDGGSQYEIQLTAFLVNGNWWIYYGGTAASNAIGYYPKSAFHGRPMTTSAKEIDYGGEVVGTTIWPPMGSGKFAATGFTHSSYQRNIFYYPDSSSAVAANLTVSQPSVSCFTDVTHDNSTVSGWITYFYFGGPGGKGC